MGHSESTYYTRNEVSRLKDRRRGSSIVIIPLSLSTLNHEGRVILSITYRNIIASVTTMILARLSNMHTKATSSELVLEGWSGWWVTGA